MRNKAEIEFLIKTAIETSGGACPIEIAATSEEEAGVIRAMLKGRHKAGAISVTAYPAEFFKDLAAGRWAEGKAP